MRALGTVTDFTEVAAQRAADKAMHPAMRARLLNAGLPQVDRARSLVAIARGWEYLVSEISSGPDSLTEEEAEETLQLMTSALVHPAARPSLVFQLPQLRQAVKAHDDMRDGNTHPAELNCMSQAEALVDCLDEIDHALYPLVHGLPVRDACRGCRRTCASVNDWQTQVGCDLHRERVL